MKKEPEEHVNLERWMVSYADFMTLLFALFVVLYSFAMAKASEAQSMAQSIAESFESGLISQSGGVLVVPDSVAQQLAEEAEKSAESSGSGDAQKESVMNGGMIMNFASSAASTADPETESDATGGNDQDIEGSNVSDSSSSSGDLVVSDNVKSNNQVPSSRNPDGGSMTGDGGMTPGGDADEIADGGRTSVDSETVGEGKNGAPFDAVRESVSNGIKEMGIEDQVDIEQDEHWLTININSGMLFAEGSASILTASRPIIARIAVVLSGINNYIRVRGYTDDTFVPDGIYRNSWDLSAQRAVNVLMELTNNSIDPRRLAVEAYGEYSPFFSNSTAAGRAQNRRVVIAISRYAIASKDLRVVDNREHADYDRVNTTNSGNSSGGRGQTAGQGNVDIVHGDDNTIMLDFSN